MTSRRLASAVAALAAGTLALAGPAFAQENCSPNNAGVYPPGQCGEAPPPAPPGQQGNVDDSSPGRGEQVRATTPAGSFDRGSRVEYGMQSTYIRLGFTTADATGAADASFVVPTQVTNGSHSIVFSGVRNGQPSTVRIPVTVAGGAPLTDAAGNVISQDGATGGTTTGSGRGVVGALPTTGRDELVPLAAGGTALVVLGTGVVLVARRRQQELSATSL